MKLCTQMKGSVGMDYIKHCIEYTHKTSRYFQCVEFFKKPSAYFEVTHSKVKLEVRDTDRAYRSSCTTAGKRTSPNAITPDSVVMHFSSFTSSSRRFTRAGHSLAQDDVDDAEVSSLVARRDGDDLDPPDLPAGGALDIQLGQDIWKGAILALN